MNKNRSHKTNRLILVNRMVSNSCSKRRSRYRSNCALTLISLFQSFVLQIISSANEHENRKPAIPSDIKAAKNRSGIETILICSKIAIEYPIGFFQSKGNLLKIYINFIFPYTLNHMNKKKQLTTLGLAM